MADYTPGPWTINEWTQSNSDIRIGAIGTPRIASIILRDVSINEQKANAHLIAAAPDIYDALLDMVHLVSDCVEEGATLTMEQEQTTAKARKALRKAVGRVIPGIDTATDEGN